MKEIYIILVLIILFITTIFSGILVANYKKEKKDRFNFLNHLPFEMVNYSSLRLTLTFRFILSLFSGMCAIASIFVLFVNGDYLLEKVLSFFLLINGIILVNLFIVDLKNYRIHIGSLIFFMVFNVISYCFLVYLPIRDNFRYYSLFLLISSSIILIGMLLLISIPTLKRWYALKLDQNGDFTRGEVLILSIVEWINILFYVFIFIILAINYLIYLF